MHKWALLLGLLNVLFVGCLTGKPSRVTTQDRYRPFQGPSGADVLTIDYVLLERPVGDLYINKDLWSHADEQIVASERRSLLVDNGLRVGQLGGMAPAGLQDMLASGRSCVDPRRRELHANTPTALPLGPLMAQCQFVVNEDGRETQITLENAQCSLVVAPTVLRDGRTRLLITPRVEYGESHRIPKPASDRSGWEIQQRRPFRDFPSLSWEMDITPEDYVIVGACYENPESLGHQSFIRRDGAAPVQRLLVFRAGKAKSHQEQDGTGLSAQAVSFRHSPSLAIQAARGRGE